MTAYLGAWYNDVIGGQYGFSWNAGLVAGFCNDFGALQLKAARTSASRATHLGFIIGWCAALEYGAHEGQILSTIFPLVVGYEPAVRLVSRLCAIDTSKLLPAACLRRSFHHATPIIVLFVGGTVRYIFCFAMNIFPRIGCINLRKRFGHLKRHYRSPLGIKGAVFSSLVWRPYIVSLLFFQVDCGVCAMVFGEVRALFTVYYHTNAKSRQTYSWPNARWPMFPFVRQVHLATVDFVLRRKPNKGSKVYALQRSVVEKKPFKVNAAKALAAAPVSP
ncbi:hypothetical protein ACHHYP_20780 [Achlya hypogyna]|uniref:Uncharacterized protein n=1 Tax=Achlya hypogyna TaxID=1202772 RepID=A0A1V9YA69_ACHHY|nr:hypothetical protein ACHHYP_20780 [Achlya hypogyna]